MTSSGSSRWVAPGFSFSATANALRTASGMISGSWMRAFHLVTGFIIRTTSMYWWLSLCISPRLVCPVRATTGARSRNASARPVTRLVAPGPSVPRHTPAWPVRRPYASAMNAAPCSCRTGTNATVEEWSSASFRSSVSSPGMPNTYRTPSFSRHRTNSSAAVAMGRKCNAAISGRRRLVTRTLPPMSGPDIVVFIPAWNEERSLPAVLDELRGELPEADAGVMTARPTTPWWSPAGREPRCSASPRIEGWAGDRRRLSVCPGERVQHLRIGSMPTASIRWPSCGG